MKLRILAIASLIIPSAFLTAQAERITIRWAPSPNQTLHVRTTMDMTMSAAPDPPTGSARPIPAMTGVMTTIAESTSTVGPTDDQGHYQARVVCDRSSFTATMNGQPMPMSSAAAQVVGLVVTFFYDDQGKVIDVTTEGAPMAAAAAAPLKQMLTSALAAAPPITLSVGETVTVPTQLSLPLPAGTGGAAMSMSGETRYTLTSVTFDGADRIAHLAMTMTSAMNLGIGVDGAGSKMAGDTRMTSEGTSDVNIDRGIVLHNEQRMTIDGAMGIHGTAKMSSDFTK
jgi:hypothetical protein